MCSCFIDWTIIQEVYKNYEGCWEWEYWIFKIQIKTEWVYWVYNAKRTRHLVAISRNWQKVVIQLWLNIRVGRLIWIKWNDYIMTGWLRPSFWVVIHADWKLWTQIMIDANDRFLCKVQCGDKFRYVTKQTCKLSFWGLPLTCDHDVTFRHSRSGKLLSNPPHYY